MSNTDTETPADIIKFNLTDFDEYYNHYKQDAELFFEKNNKSAATRARKSLLEMSKLCKKIRQNIQDTKNGVNA